jgi:hypothetical protein
MKKVLVFVALFAGLGALAKLFGPRMKNVDWEKRFEATPDDAPPKWILRNVTAIRENTERILAVLEQDRDSARSTEPAPRI